MWNITIPQQISGSFWREMFDEIVQMKAEHLAAIAQPGLEKGDSIRTLEYRVQQNVSKTAVGIELSSLPLQDLCANISQKEERLRDTALASRILEEALRKARGDRNRADAAQVDYSTAFNLLSEAEKILKRRLGKVEGLEALIKTTEKSKRRSIGKMKDDSRRLLIMESIRDMILTKADRERMQLDSTSAMLKRVTEALQTVRNMVNQISGQESGEVAESIEVSPSIDGEDSTNRKRRRKN
jgi:hypothetical protein